MVGKDPGRWPGSFPTWNGGGERMSINWRSAHTVGVLMTVLLATLGGSAGPVSAKAKRHPRHKVRHLHQSAKPKHGGAGGAGGDAGAGGPGGCNVGAACDSSGDSGGNGTGLLTGVGNGSNGNGGNG